MANDISVIDSNFDTSDGKGTIRNNVNNFPTFDGIASGQAIDITDIQAKYDTRFDDFFVYLY